MAYCIEEMESLRDSLGKHGVERLKYEHDSASTKRGKNIENTVLHEMQGRKPSNSFCGVSDIIAGVCRLDHYSQKGRNIPLSQNRMYNILQTMDVINTREVMEMMGVGDRYARHYVKACGIALKILEVHFKEEGNSPILDDI
jgi:hypothetical protein